MFVNCQVHGWVIGFGGLSHPVKVDVRLVSFPWPAFEMTSPQTKIRVHTPRRPRGCSCDYRSSGEIAPTWLRQLPQCLLQLSQPVDFRYGSVQRLNGCRDMIEKRFVTFDEPKKSVSA